MYETRNGRMNRYGENHRWPFIPCFELINTAVSPQMPHTSGTRWYAYSDYLFERIPNLIGHVSLGGVERLIEGHGISEILIQILQCDGDLLA